jgi:HAD superfamily hydrolase (TIGR01458 family)
MKPLLIDIDGVLKLGKEPAPGLAEFIDFLNASEIPFCAISNSTLSNSKLQREFFEINNIQTDFPLMTAADAALEYVRLNYNTAAAFASEPIKSMFSELLDYENPECVVVGDLERDWNFDIMNQIFNYVLNGADFIAMQKNKFWKTPEAGYLLDAGAFVKAIEYASGKEAVLIGKPSKGYFSAAIALCGSKIEDGFFMLGDDLISDIEGAQNSGGKGILIYSGKTSFPYNTESGVTPDYEAKDLYQTITLLKELYAEEK